MSMPVGAGVSVEEYLHTAYEPDCEYIDGELVERHVGEYPHSRLQGFLYAYFLRRWRKWGITPVLAQRIRIRQGKYLIPDLCIIRGPEPTDRVLTQPPWIWIEILSSGDRPIRVQRKVQAVLEFGAEYVWVIDPETLESIVYTAHSQRELLDKTFRIEGTDIVVPLDALLED